MLKRAANLGLAIIIISMPLLAVIWLTLSDSEVGMTKDVGMQSSSLPIGDYSSVPQTVVDRAVEMASELVGDSREKLQNVVDQLLATYVEARDRDVVVVFNPGGWGWNIFHKDTPLPPPPKSRRNTGMALD